ncbi:hypothetical protein CHS0354_023124 [Potamilus streckersoni]|uniref:RRM domain-containing protein n=1 Tax=Potamilus streckersoni TaxID=2493646 RepID=A0AAE0RNA4_9BIVA|nr:hypothetical protein CHS0354_023124 [Potamilus streckersoni]
MYNGLEVIDFTRPDGSRRNLFITNIPASFHEDDIVSLFYTIFGKYGLIYGVQVFPFKWQLDDKKSANQSGGYYGFVTFYSSLSAALAKEDLNNKVIIEGNECKISFAKRKKKVQESQILHFTRCRELANYYLGFNGWSSQIKLVSGRKNFD